tara:strand:+ start:125 stop:376 length:252 start_codon:yes stop_codon:yes gene_type:complete
MVVTNMKELLIYAKQQKKLRASEHRRKHAHEGLCSGLSDVEYNRVKHSQKSTFTKARKFTHNRMWRNHTKKFTVEQLKLIKTL